MDESVPEYRKFKTPDEIVAWFKRIKERSVDLAGRKVNTVNLVVNFCEDGYKQDYYCVGGAGGGAAREALVGDLFDFSLKGYSIWCFGTTKFMEHRPEFRLYLKRTRDHSTNIVPETLDALRYLLS
jgi:hypothetical protein